MSNQEEFYREEMVLGLKSRAEKLLEKIHNSESQDIQFNSNDITYLKNVPLKNLTREINHLTEKIIGEFLAFLHENEKDIDDETLQHFAENFLSSRVMNFNKYKTINDSEGKEDGRLTYDYEIQGLLSNILTKYLDPAKINQALGVDNFNFTSLLSVLAQTTEENDDYMIEQLVQKASEGRTNKEGLKIIFQTFKEIFIGLNHIMTGSTKPISRDFYPNIINQYALMFNILEDMHS
jgi:hypothetical protein